MNRVQTNKLEFDTGPIERSIERILAAEEDIVPSSGFLASVMGSVEAEARMPAPIPFPWKRAIPGILLAVGVFGWGAFAFIREAIRELGSVALSQPHLSLAAERPLEPALWVGLALVLSLASWLLSRRLAGESGWF